MKTVILAVLLTASCVAGTKSNTLINESDIPWISETITSVVPYWNTHGMDFEIVSYGGIDVSPYHNEGKDIDLWGLYDIVYNEIRLNDALNDSSRFDDEDLRDRFDTPDQQEDFIRNLDQTSKKCVLAHELGHAIGMEHASEGTSALMRPTLSICDVYGITDDDDCCWSESDEISLLSLPGG